MLRGSLKGIVEMDDILLRLSDYYVFKEHWNPNCLKKRLLDDIAVFSEALGRKAALAREKKNF